MDIKTCLIFFISLSLVRCSHIGPKDREFTDNDRTYTLTEEEIFSGLSESNKIRVTQRRLSTCKSRLHGYYFIYWSQFELEGETIRLKVRGALLNEKEKAIKIHRVRRFSGSERSDLAAIYNIDSVFLGHGANNFEISLLDSSRTYSIEIEGITILEEEIRDEIKNKLEHFKEINLKGYPLTWP